MRVVALIVLCGAAMVASSGCVTKGRHQQEVGNLQNQIAQMDVALKAQQERTQALEAELLSVREGAAQARLAQRTGGEFQGGIYRTPSGFELPAADIQKALKNAGYYAGGVDGKVGPESREAIRNFQRDNGLVTDGVCGRQTWAKLKTYLEVLK